MFKNLNNIMGIREIALDEYKVRINKWGDELKDFMMLAEKKCRTFQKTNIKWSLATKVLPRRRWDIARFQKFIAK